MRKLFKPIATLAILFACCTAALRAQELALPAPGSPRLTFDVISIRRADPKERGGVIQAMPSGQGYLSKAVPVRLMISLMYKIPSRQIVGGLDWINSELFDVQAKADKAYNLDDLHAMYQNMLVDRFGFKFHVETRDGNIYGLTIDSSGLKMHPNTSPEDFIVPVQFTGQASLTGTRVPLNYLCWQLGQFVQNDERPVINQTGLTGNYDFKLTFRPLELPPGADKDNLPPGFLDRPDLFTALREQLGLKLTPRKGPVTYMVIDHIDKPSEN